MIFYESFYEAAKYLQPADRTAFLNAVLEYGCEGKEPDFDGVPMAMFLMAKPIIDANKARKENGAKGGRPKKVRTAGNFCNYEQRDPEYYEKAFDELEVAKNKAKK